MHGMKNTKSSNMKAMSSSEQNQKRIGPGNRTSASWKNQSFFLCDPSQTDILEGLPDTTTWLVDGPGKPCVVFFVSFIQKVFADP